jgi:hypothetical protein
MTARHHTKGRNPWHSDGRPHRLRKGRWERERRFGATLVAAGLVFAAYALLWLILRGFLALM